MKPLVCEMCSSPDVIKQDGMYVCQHCGTKYTVEEARKMMIEGTVDVSGSTVKVDNSSFVEKYLANARRAKQKEDWEEVEKYYNLVEQNDPTNIEAIFYSSYAKAMSSMIDPDVDMIKREHICKVFCNSISVIDDNYKVEKSAENQVMIKQMSDDLFGMYKIHFVCPKSAKKDFDHARSTQQKYYKCMSEAFIDSVQNIIKVDDQLVYWKLLYQHHISVANYHVVGKCCKMHREIAISIGTRIREKDPSFEVIEKASGCYIATAVYGSYDCPQVWTLRRYRDNTLAATWYGRAFIRTYYAISPTLVKWFGNTGWFKKLWKGKLDRMVAGLKAQGVEDTPYRDRNW